MKSCFIQIHKTLSKKDILNSIILNLLFFSRMSSKFDSSLFAFGSNSKKHPNSLILGRLYDSTILDMIELQVAEYKPAMEFDVRIVFLNIYSNLYCEN